MKYISGGDCLARLRNAPGGRLDELTVADWGMQVADVLDYLHNQRPPIIYRDLKPANLMIDGNTGRVMLIDFGIARWVAAAGEGRHGRRHDGLRAARTLQRQGRAALGHLLRWARRCSTC